MSQHLDIHDFVHNLKFSAICAKNPATDARRAVECIVKNHETNAMFREREIIESKNYNVFVTDQHIVVEIQLKQNGDMNDQFAPYICVDGIVSEIKMIKMQIVLDDHVFENITDPVPMKRYQHGNAKLRLFYLADDPHRYVFTNQHAYIVLEHMTYFLQGAIALQLANAPSCVYLNQIIRSDDSAHCRGSREQIISGNTFMIHEKKCDIKSIVFETIDLETHEVKPNIVHSVELRIGANRAGYFKNINNIMQIESLPAYMSIYTNICMNIYTNNIPLDKNCVIVARYQCDDPDPVDYKNYLKGAVFEYCDGIFRSGCFIPKQ
jgi:hypothetical protein